MGSLTLHASGPAPARAVWEAYADPHRWAQWSPHIRGVEAVGRLRPGLTGRVLAIVPLAVNFEVTKVDAKGRKWSWRTFFGPIRLSFDHGVTTEGAGSGTWLTMHGPLPLLVIYAPFARLALHRLTRITAEPLAEPVR